MRGDDHLKWGTKKESFWCCCFYTRSGQGTRYSRFGARRVFPTFNNRLGMLAEVRFLTISCHNAANNSPSAPRLAPF